MLDVLTQESPGVCVVDLSQIALATAFNTYEEGDRIDINFVRHLVIATLRTNVMKAKQEGYPKIVLAIDNGKNGYWRRDIAHYYKRNRAANRDKSTWDWDGYFNSMNEVIDELKNNMPYYVIDVHKAEADDVIASITQDCSMKNIPVLIISSDGDFTQLHKFDQVKQWSPMQKKFIYPKYGIPKLDLTYKIMKGDKKDNVASINVRADFLSTRVEGERQPAVKTSLIESVCECIDDGSIEKLLTPSQWARYQENRLLIDFDYIDSNIKTQILEQFNSYKVPAKGKIYSYFVKNGLNKHLSNINDF